ncbi:hypothetical protein ACFRQM_30360 [Streptomyces sp. NPDC056831]|uniref:hypothetical protein n=1 Tax=Streptomyces sp. NPDC056831 TaxID=3345954 RepID=UPI00367DCDF8
MPAARAAKAQIRARVRRSSAKRALIADSPMFQSPGSRMASVTTPVATSAVAATEDRRAAKTATRYTTSNATSLAEVVGTAESRAS